MNDKAGNEISPEMQSETTLNDNSETADSCHEAKAEAFSGKFTVDRSCIPTALQNEQEKEFCELGVEVYEQEILEKEICHQVDRALEEQRKTEKANLEEKKSKDEGSCKKRNEKEQIDLGCALPEETERERKIRTGEMTPFGTVMSLKRIEGNNFEKIEEYFKKQIEINSSQKVQKRKRNGFKSEEVSEQQAKNTVKKPVLKRKLFFPKRKPKKQALGCKISEEYEDLLKSPGKLESEVNAFNACSSGSEYVPTESDEDDVDFEVKPKTPKVKKSSKRKLKSDSNKGCSDSDNESAIFEKSNGRKDDGDETTYLNRIEDWEKNCNRDEIETQVKALDDGFKMPLSIWNKLYNYQKVGVQWFWELNVQRCGGILGDEMGLGKTIQVVAFLAGLSVSKLVSRHGSFRGLGPVLIVCPTTVMHQWVGEFHEWWPQFRVALLHESGTYHGKKQNLIRDIVKGKGILITSYVTCIQQSDSLLRYPWHYVILDEGHKIRNPDSQIANTVKLLNTPHRLILSGSPMQNNLKELWSLFDFIFPGKLGSLQVFMAEFGVPITQGGYANASKIQVATAYKCATVLRDTISPYLLRRVKEDVKNHINLPPKNEQVLFCRLTEEQKELYVSYLNSGRVNDILSGKYKIFVGLIELRKICNHPDLFTGGPKLFKWEDPDSVAEENKFGYWKKAGKMIVVETLLKIWKKQGHRVLIFTQSRQMLHILEAFVSSQNYEYIKMDGTTYIGSRQKLISEFNEDKKYFIFLSTTHVGGLGINLTGANRVVIYDPDWNPATDVQARERAWRIGQENQVTIYRLVTSGTIEEKIYHRQIFKQFLTNKILKDPSQRRFFKSNDLYELFTYKGADDASETSAIFAGTDIELNSKNFTKARKRHRLKDKMRLEPRSMKKDGDAKNVLTKEKIEKMKLMAQELSRKIALEISGKRQAIDSKPEESSTCLDFNSNDGSHKNPDSQKERPSNLENSANSSGISVKKAKKRKRKTKDTCFEGETVPHLEKQRDYRDVLKEGKDHKKDDDYILKKLFSKSGVQSALKHDKIMEEGNADYALIEGEADKVAKEAVKALKESRRQYMNFFSQGLPSQGLSKPRFGRKTFGRQPPPMDSKEDANDKVGPLTSAELLQRIRCRNGLSSSSFPLENSKNEFSDLLCDIRNFISFGAKMDSKATTQEIIDKFKDRLPAGQTPIFRSLLNEICKFHRTSNGEGVWQLRPDLQW